MTEPYYNEYASTAPSFQTATHTAPSFHGQYNDHMDFHGHPNSIPMSAVQSLSENGNMPPLFSPRYTQTLEVDSCKTPYVPDPSSLYNTQYMYTSGQPSLGMLPTFPTLTQQPGYFSEPIPPQDFYRFTSYSYPTQPVSANTHNFIQPHALMSGATGHASWDNTYDTIPRSMGPWTGQMPYQTTYAPAQMFYSRESQESYEPGAATFNGSSFAQSPASYNQESLDADIPQKLSGDVRGRPTALTLKEQTRMAALALKERNRLAAQKFRINEFLDIQKTTVLANALETENTRLKLQYAELKRGFQELLSEQLSIMGRPGSICHDELQIGVQSLVQKDRMLSAEWKREQQDLNEVRERCARGEEKKRAAAGQKLVALERTVAAEKLARRNGTTPTQPKKGGRKPKA